METLYLVDDRESQPVESVDDLVAYFRAAGKPRERWRVGTEHEMLGVYASGDRLGQAIPYEGPDGIGAVLESLASRGWKAVREGANIIALTFEDSQVAIEPGGQLEHAARPLHSSEELLRDLQSFFHQIEAPSRDFGIVWLSTAFRPFGTLDDVPWMPKSRYQVMRDYLPSRGGLAHEMMKRTTTVQTNLDYADADDALRKLRASMSVTSILTALYANSPIVDGAESGFQSYRGHIWTDTDPDRCGLLDFVFDDGDVFRAYTEWALDIPMFFIHRQHYVPVGGTTFRQFWREGFGEHRATVADWGLHLSTLFPEVRMKQFLEVRGCDAGPLPMLVSLAALSRGLLYDDQALADATRLTAGLSFDQRLALASSVHREGLRATAPGGRTVRELAVDLLDIATDGLRRQAPDEVRFLDPLREIAESGRSRADAVIALWRDAKGDPAQVIPALAHDLGSDGL